MTKSHGPEFIKLFSYSTKLSTKFILLINVKMPILACWHFSIYQHDKILDLIDLKQETSLFVCILVFISISNFVFS